MIFYVFLIAYIYGYTAWAVHACHILPSKEWHSARAWSTVGSFHRQLVPLVVANGAGESWHLTATATAMKSIHGQLVMEPLVVIIAWCWEIMVDTLPSMVMTIMLIIVFSPPIGVHKPFLTADNSSKQNNRQEQD